MRKETMRVMALAVALIMSFCWAALAEEATEMDALAALASYFEGGELPDVEMESWLFAAATDPAAAEYLEKAQSLAEEGDLPAQLFLGLYYKNAIPEDLLSASRWFQMANAAGNQFANEQLAIISVWMAAGGCCR